MKLIVTFFVIFLGLGSVVIKDTERRIISDDAYNYTFFISNKKKISTADHKEYHWYKTGAIHNSRGAVHGKVLHGEFRKTYRSNGLAEQGEFSYGLKIKSWKNWYQNGEIKKIEQWQDGVLTGAYKEFDEQGNLFWTGRYRNNKKQGRWINHITKDTLYYKKGEKVDKKQQKEDTSKTKKSEKKAGKSFKVKTQEFFKKLFEKKSPAEKRKIKKEKELRKKQKEIEKKKKSLITKKKKNQKTKTQKKQ